MKTQYALCIVFTKDLPDKLRIETVMFCGSIIHNKKDDPNELFDKDLAVNEALKESKSIDLIESGNKYFLSNHIILPGASK